MSMKVDTLLCCLLLLSALVSFTCSLSQPKPNINSKSSNKPPQWWSNGWNLLPSKPGQPGSPIGWGDALGFIRTQLEETLFDSMASQDNAEEYFQVPVAVNEDPSKMQSNFFESVARFRNTVGPVFEINLGVTKVKYIGDPMATKHILLNAGAYDKGLLGFIGGDVFGEGLITALDREVWRRRRRAVAPTLGAANKDWLTGLIQDFEACTRGTFYILDDIAAVTAANDMTNNSNDVVDLEETCLAIALDALGVTVFGTNFGATNNIGREGGDPLVKAVYRVLKETNIRSEKPASILAASIRPTWLAEFLFPEYKEFRNASRLLDNKINELIADLKTSVEGGSYDGKKDTTPSILRILVESRDGQATSQQLKDDLVTLLIAGHETVASVLTWALYELSRNPSELIKVQAEIDAILGTDPNNHSSVTLQNIVALEHTRRALTESLRMYPAPPLLSRRALKDDFISLTDADSPPLQLKRGDNVFLLTAMLHRDPRIYGDDAEKFRPARWGGPISSNDPTIDWKGYEGPQADPRALYPSEKATDFALIGFGAGEFKCVGDKFAFVEATVALALLLQRYEFELVTEDVGFDMAGTIHTSKGLMARVKRRNGAEFRSVHEKVALVEAPSK